ncbi:hypothetical protein [Cupriavidus sp. H39]|uniref:hypothetical protein n=1 Tax=Cupriavidus sp. H39 TaxID=3401635 RepID=UPI003D049C95
MATEAWSGVAWYQQNRSTGIKHRVVRRRGHQRGHIGFGRWRRGQDEIRVTALFGKRPAGLGIDDDMPRGNARRDLPGPGAKRFLVTGNQLVQMAAGKRSVFACLFTCPAERLKASSGCRQPDHGAAGSRGEPGGGGNARCSGSIVTEVDHYGSEVHDVIP